MESTSDLSVDKEEESAASLFVFGDVIAFRPFNDWFWFVTVIVRLFDDCCSGGGGGVKLFSFELIDWFKSDEAALRGEMRHGFL